MLSADGFLITLGQFLPKLREKVRGARWKYMQDFICNLRETSEFNKTQKLDENHRSFQNARAKRRSAEVSPKSGTVT